MQYSDRSLLPEETLENVMPWLAGFGVTRLARLTGLDRPGIPVWNAVVPNSRSIVINQGKGLTDIDAKVSAAMEAIERAVAGAPFCKPVMTTQQQLLDAGCKAITLTTLIAPHQSDLSAHEVIAWLPAHDLISNQEVYVPQDAVILDRTISNSRFWQTSDGLASGNTFEEATLHGLLERIERDAEILWRVKPFERRAQDCVDPAAFGDAVLDDLITKIDRAGLMLRLFDIKSDAGIPCFTALLASADILTMHAPRFIDVTSGHGCHLNAVRAAIRAITEAAQSRLTYISGARDDVYPKTFIAPLPDDLRRCFTIVPEKIAANQADVPQQLPEMLTHILARLRGMGVGSAIAVRLSDETMPFAVVRMLVEGLENPDGARKRRFGPRALSFALANS